LVVLNASEPEIRNTFNSLKVFNINNLEFLLYLLVLLVGDLLGDNKGTLFLELLVGGVELLGE
jgi:hypothetical protein